MKNKNGVSLIVLVITIVVVIILAAAVILSLSGNNPINNARIANLDQTKDGIESSILAYSGKAQSQTLGYYTVTELLTGNREETEEYSIIGDKETTNNNDEAIYNIDKSKFESKIDTLPSTPTANGEWYVDGNGKVYLVYDKKESMPKWMLNKDGDVDDTFLNKFVVIKGSAEEVANNPGEYYGKTVTNYTANGVSDWKIFHSDGTNIYLISSEYLPLDKIPATKNGSTFTKGAYAKSATLISAVDDSNYSSGSENISINNPARKWLNLYLDNYSSTSNNMKAVAYMLDTDVWNVYKTDEAKYAIGGPTIEMLMESYNNKKGTNYQVKVENAIGYKINDEDNAKIFDISEILYVLHNGTESGADAMWISSPSNISSNDVMYVGFNGYVSGSGYRYNGTGFRPVVCLRTNIEVEKNTDGNVTLK